MTYLTSRMNNLSAVSKKRIAPPTRFLLPRVGSKHYSYTKAGKAAAKKEAKRTGKKVTHGKKKRTKKKK